MGLSVALAGSRGHRAPLRVALMASTALLASVAAAQAQQAWTGATSTDWFDATNWTPNTVPADGDQPTVDTTTLRAPVIDGATAPTAGSYPQIFIGESATGTLTIQNAGTLNVDNAFIGDNAGSNGTVTMTGASIWNSTGTSNGTIVGFNGTGTFNVNGGSTVNTANTIVGFGSASNGSVTVDASTWNQTGAAPLSALFVGYGGTGSFTVQNGGTVSAVDTYVGHLAGSNGTATVTGVGSTWTGNSFFIGNSGTGMFNVLAGGILTANSDTFLGYSSGATGTLNVDGAGSKFSLTNNKTLFVGGGGPTGGTGIVNVTNGGTLDMNGSVTLLGVSGGNGTMNFDASTWNPGSAVAVGFSGTGTVNITNGSVVTLNGQILVGDSASSHGTVTVSGASSQFSSIALVDLVIGQGGTGQFTVQNGATAGLLGGLVIGAAAGSSGTVTVQNGSSFTTDRGNITIGQNGTGTMNVLNGSSFTATQGTGPSADAFVGFAAGATGTLNIQSGSTFTNTGDLTVGSNGTGAVNLSGAGSTLTTSGLFVGDNRGTGTVTITDGGVANVSGVIGLGNNTSGAFGTVTVSGGGSQFNSTDATSGDIAIGVDGTGVFNVLNGATANFATDVFLGFGNGSGTVNVQSGANFTTTASLLVGFNGTGIVNVSGASSQLNVGGGIYVGEDGTGTVNVTNGGTANITGTAFLGDCFCSLGTMTVSGAGSNWTSAGAEIGTFGTGQFNVLDGASASLGDIFVGTGLGNGTLKIDAASQVNGTSYTQGSTGTFNIGISPAGNGKLTVSGGGNIDLTNGGAGSGALVVNAKTTLAKTYTIMTTDGTLIYLPSGFSSVSVVGNANNLRVLYD